MQEDLISNDFVENIDRQLLKRNLRIGYLAILLVFTYSIISLVDWYVIFEQSASVGDSASYIFYFRIRPWMDIFNMLIGILNWGLILKANRSIIISVETKDAHFFNKGYQYFYAGNWCAVISYIIVTCSLLIPKLL